MTDLSVRDLTVEYDSGGYVIRPLDSLTFEARSGELVILLGPSGSGKSTLLSCLAGILSPTRGAIEVGGQEVTGLQGKALARYRSRTVGIVFQAFNLLPSLTAEENVEVPLVLSGRDRRSSRRRARELLDMVGLSDRMRHRPATLSGGQQQRVAIARALVHDPPLVLADEPTAHLDHIQVETVVQLIRSIAASGRLVAVATHDERVLPLADRTVDLAPRPDVAPRAPEEIWLAEGRVLFEQGSRGDLVYVVEQGEMEIYRVRSDGSEEPVAVVGRGEYLGELGPLLRLPRSASARARTPAVVTGYSLEEFRRRIGSDGARPYVGGQRPSTER